MPVFDDPCPVARMTPYVREFLAQCHRDAFWRAILSAACTAVMTMFGTYERAST